MSIDNKIQEAIEIGESNKRIIELAQNWCGHLTVEKAQWGGTGLVEVQTGLPIGARHFKCQYASAAGIAGMNLEVVALDFYDRNCAGCKQRLPVRLPNLSELVANRDSARSRAGETEREAAEIEMQALRRRIARRAELARNCDAPIVAILASIDQLDRDPSEENRLLLSETVAAAAAHFTPDVVDALFELADAGGFARTQAALELLQRVATDKNRLCEVALRALARDEGPRIAGSIVASHLSEGQQPLVRPALPALIRLALPMSGFLHMSASPGDPEPLTAVF